MTRYSVQPRDQIFVKGYRFLSFAGKIGKILVKISVKTWAVNTIRHFLIMLNNLLQILKTSSKTAEATVDLIGNKIANKITVSKTSPQNNSEENIENDSWWSKINIIIIYNSGI